MAIAPIEIISYFSERKNRFINSEGMEFMLVDKFGIITSLTFLDYDSGDLEMIIHTDGFSEEEFIQHFRLQSIDDIDRLGYNNSWMLYLNGHAVISAKPIELDAEIGFRILGFKTIIFSTDLHFYDEVYEHLTLMEDFENFLKQSEDQLFKISSIRYQMGRNQEYAGDFRSEG